MAGLGDERGRYHKDVETLAADHPWHRIRAHVPPDSSVLDVGCGSGALGSFLSSRTANVDGVEVNDDRADYARQHLKTVVTGEAGPSIDSALPRSYDVIIFADVLEHVVQPDQVLAWAASKLADDGRIIALIPNSANWKFRRKMMRGDWSYAETGYFDRDHLRFFDVRTARAAGAVGRTPGDRGRVRRRAVAEATERLVEGCRHRRQQAAQPVRRPRASGLGSELISCSPVHVWAGAGTELLEEALNVATVQSVDALEYRAPRASPTIGGPRVAPVPLLRSGSARRVPDCRRRLSTPARRW